MIKKSLSFVLFCLISGISSLSHCLETTEHFSALRYVIPVILTYPTTEETLPSRILEVNKYAEFASKQLSADTCTNELATVGQFTADELKLTDPFPEFAAVGEVGNSRKSNWKLANEYFQKALWNYQSREYIKGDKNLELALGFGYVAVEDAAFFWSKKDGCSLQEKINEIICAIESDEGSPMHYPTVQSAQDRFSDFAVHYPTVAHYPTVQRIRTSSR